MVELSISQALFDGPALRARSHLFADECQARVEPLIQKYGPPSAAQDDPALFVQPLGRSYVGIFRVLGPRFHILVLNRQLYNLLHDPFQIAERFAVNWDARGHLPDLAWPAEPLPPRTAAELDGVLKNGDGPFLLGASQTLVDGGRIAVHGDAPQNKLIRDLWSLLPHGVRRTISLATLAPSPELGFDILVMREMPEGGLPGYLSEDQARDYPESGYERQLQAAIEWGDQPSLDKLLARRSAGEMNRLALIIIGIMIGATILAKLLAGLQGF